MDVSIELPSDADQDAIEDALDEAIGELGEVTGGEVRGSGMIIDLDVEDDADPAELLQLIRAALKELGVTPRKIHIDGKSC